MTDLDAVRGALAGVEDPCMASAGIDLSVLDLGLVTEVRIHGDAVEVDLTFTELGCSFSHLLLAKVADVVEAVPGVRTVDVRPVWRPGWTPDRLSERARAEIGSSTGRLSALARAPARPVPLPAPAVRTPS